MAAMATRFPARSLADFIFGSKVPSTLMRHKIDENAVNPGSGYLVKGAQPFLLNRSPLELPYVTVQGFLPERI